MKFDYIIVGAGSAGAIVADRLSESGQYSVLLLETGGKDDSFWFKLPVGFAHSYYNPQCNYMYYTEPQEQLGQRKAYQPRGKVQGGSGSINAMIYVRGQQHDFDDWEGRGNQGWSYQDLLPYFKKLETHPQGENEQHGGSGKINITPMRDQAHPICQEYLQGCRELGYQVLDDLNDPHANGAGIYDINTKNGQRCSSSFAYLHPALSRSNLRFECLARTERILFDESKTRAIGVEYVQNGQRLQAIANKEVILCGGAVNSPQLLQLSGVGDQTLLESLRIPLVKHLPAVGQNLQDHLCASYYYKANRQTLNDDLGSLWGQFKAGVQYLFTRKGPLSLSVNQAGGFFKGDESLKHPNIQLYFNPLSYQIPKDPKARLVPEPYSGFLLAFNPCRPTSRGTVTIVSGDPAQAPAIDPQYLTTQHDIDEVIQGNRLVRKIMSSPALKAITVEEVIPGPQLQSDEELLAYFRANCGSIYHLCGSCIMGPNEGDSVVTPQLKVHGINGLRIVDASIFPNVTSGNINATTMMVAEKGSDLILADARG